MERITVKLRFNDFKDSWIKTKFQSQCLKISSGKNKIEEYGQFPVYGSTGKLGYTNNFTHDGNYILVARVGANAGQLNCVQGKFGVTDNTLVIELENEDEFIFYYYLLQSVNLNKFIFGSGQPLITGGMLKSLNILQPNIRVERQKIADFLSSVDKKISLLKEKHALLTQYKKGVMQKLFKQEIRFKDDNGNAFPDWQIKPLSKLADKNNLKNKDNAVNAVLTNSAKSGIVNQGDYFNKDIANQGNLTGYTVVEKNDFIYNPRISELAPVGPIKRNHIGQGVMSPLYTAFRFKDENVLDYLEQYFNTTMWHRYMHSIANFGARHDRMNITSADFYALPIPLPCEGEREKIVSFIKALETKVNAVNEQIELTKTFKKGLLQQMFV